jgi:hypothetical protein
MSEDWVEGQVLMPKPALEFYKNASWKVSIPRAYLNLDHCVRARNVASRIEHAENSLGDIVSTTMALLLELYTPNLERFFLSHAVKRATRELIFALQSTDHPYSGLSHLTAHIWTMIYRPLPCGRKEKGLMRTNYYF